MHWVYRLSFAKLTQFNFVDITSTTLDSECVSAFSQRAHFIVSCRVREYASLVRALLSIDIHNN